jgi:hypothetical protein
MPSTATADRKVGDLWYDSGNNNTPYFWNGSAWVANTDTTRASQAALTTEQSARSSADAAVAAYALTASAGTGRVYTSDPGTVSRQNGDVWFKTEENFKPYVWYNGQWNDNSSGAYTQYVGQIASVTQTASAAYSTANSAQTTANQANTTATTANNTANTLANNLGYEWRVQGTIDGQPAGSIKLTGAKKFNADGTSSTVSNLIIDANATINGSLVVNGSITGGKIATGSNGIANANIQNEAVSTNGFVSGPISSSNTTQSTSVSIRPGGRAQFVGILDSSNSIIVKSAAWTNNTITGVSNTTPVPASDQPSFKIVGYLNVKMAVAGQSDVTKSYKIIGIQTSTYEVTDYADLSGRYIKHREWVFEPTGVTGIAYYPNTDNINPKTATFTMSVTTGANSGDLLTSSVTGCATELSK